MSNFNNKVCEYNYYTSIIKNFNIYNSSNLQIN